jgi:hypothetical protein
MYNTDTKAWKVTEANPGVLHNISNVDEQAFIQNIGWVLVEDWSEKPRFLLMPERIFHDIYPKVEFTELEVDKTAESEKPIYSKSQLEDLLEKATQLGFMDDVAHWKKELEKVNV